MTPMFRKTVPRRAGLCMTPPMSPSPSMRMSINAWRSQELGYGRDSRLKIKVSVRDLPYLLDPEVIMIDQMKQVYIDGDLETIDTTNWFPKVMRKDYIVGLAGAGSGPDPDQNLQLLLRVRRRIELQWVL